MDLKLYYSQYPKDDARYIIGIHDICWSYDDNYDSLINAGSTWLLGMGKNGKNKNSLCLIFLFVFSHLFIQFT